MNTATIIRTAILIAWAAAMGVLLRFEAYPEWFTHTIPGYKGLIADSLLARESWSRIRIGDTPVGYSHTSLGINDDTPGQHLEINNRVHLRVLLFGEPRNLFAQTLVTLDRDFDLVSFAASASAGEFAVQASGERRQGRLFEVTITTGGARTVRTVEIPPETFFYSPGQELALRSLRPGGRLSLRTINPMTLQPSTVIIEAIARETIQHDGTATASMRLRSTWQGVAFDSWVNDEGIVLRQETPQGWIIEACSAEDALDAVSGEHPPPDLFAGGGGSFFNLLMGKANTTP